MSPPISSFKKLGKRQKKRRLNSIWKNVSESLVQNNHVEVENENVIEDNLESVASDSSTTMDFDLSVDDKNNNQTNDNNYSDETPEVLDSISLLDRPSMSESQSDFNESSSDQCDVSDVYENSACLNNCSDFLRNSLGNWIKNEKQVPHASLDRLLKELGEKFDLPKSTKTLLGNFCSYDITQMGDGEYLHFNNFLNDIRNLCSTANISNASLIVNIDGVPLSNSFNVTKYHAYPILVHILELRKIVCAGIYCSSSFTSTSLPSPDEFLDKFISNIKLLLLDQNFSTNFKLVAFCCDAPIRSYLKGIISHSGYDSCERCIVHGSYTDRTVILSETNCLLRSDESFKERRDASHHKEIALNVLELNEFPMVSGFILDSMHLCYLGVSKRIINRLLNCNITFKRSRISRSARSTVHNKLLEYQNFVPSEFNRKLEGGTKYIFRWKASQYRLFTLYIAIVLLNNKNLVPRNIYQNFLNYSLALRLLNSDDQYQNIEFIRVLLLNFVNGSAPIYGSSFICYNVHSLIHLPDDYLKFGNLSKITAFPFESYLGAHIKGAVRAGFKPLQQIGSHICQINQSPSKPIENHALPTKIIKNCIHENIEGICYKNLSIGNIIFKTDNAGSNDSYVLLPDNSICKIIAIHKHIDTLIFKFSCFDKISDLFKIPTASSNFGIYKFENHSHIIIKKFDVDECKFKKLFVLPFKKQSKVAIVMLNS